MDEHVVDYVAAPRCSVLRARRRGAPGVPEPDVPQGGARARCAPALRCRTSAAARADGVVAAHAACSSCGRSPSAAARARRRRTSGTTTATPATEGSTRGRRRRSSTARPPPSSSVRRRARSAASSAPRAPSARELRRPRRRRRGVSSTAAASTPSSKLLPPPRATPSRSAPNSRYGVASYRAVDRAHRGAAPSRADLHRKEIVPKTYVARRQRRLRRARAVARGGATTSASSVGRTRAASHSALHKSSVGVDAAKTRSTASCRRRRSRARRARDGRHGTCRVVSRGSDEAHPPHPRAASRRRRRRFGAGARSFGMELAAAGRHRPGATVRPGSDPGASAR